MTLVRDRRGLLEAHLSEEQLRLFGAGRPVSLPPRPRPARHDACVVRHAARKFASDSCLSFHAPSDELASEIGSFGSAAADPDTLAERLASIGYAMDRHQRDALESWPKAITAALEDLVREWVQETCPPAPFADIARVTVRLPLGRRAEGVAYRSPDCEPTATCYFVEDGRLTDFLGGRRSDYFIGGAIAAWEDVLQVRPATAEDRRRYETYYAEERALDIRLAYEQSARPRHEAFDRASRDVARQFVSSDASMIETELRDALTRLASQRRLDPESKDAALVVGALLALRGTRFESDFMAAKETVAA